MTTNSTSLVVNRHPSTPKFKHPPTWSNELFPHKKEYYGTKKKNITGTLGRRNFDG